MAKTSNSTSKKSEKEKMSWAPGMPFGKINYILMIVGIIVSAIGYILLSGGGTNNPNEFSDAIFDTRRLVVAPIVICLGIVIEFVAIMFKCNCKKDEVKSNSEGN